MKAWITYKRTLLELQDTLKRSPIQDAFISTATEILLALLDDKINEPNEMSKQFLTKTVIEANVENAKNNGLKLVVDDEFSAHTELTSKP